VPTGFTPNRNGVNDVLRPILYNVAELRYFKVYNRWGQLVFQTSEKGKGWDGTLKGNRQPAETYSWIVECTDRDGNPVKESGRSVLIR
jgi:gliding motility-associated-like protein